MTITVPNDEQVRRAWEGMLGAEIRSAYYGEMVGRMQLAQCVGTWLTLVFSSGAVAATILSLPADWQWLRTALAVPTAVISLWLLTRQYPRMGSEAADLHHRWNKLANEYTRLWEDLYSPSALATLNALDDRAADLSKAGTHLPLRRARLNACQDHVLRLRHIEAGS